MKVIQYFVWVLLYHLVTFYKQNPLAFAIGIVLWPYWLLTRLIHPTELHKEIVTNGISMLQRYWQMEGAILPPIYIKQRFIALARDCAKSS